MMNVNYSAWKWINHESNGRDEPLRFSWQILTASFQEKRFVIHKWTKAYIWPPTQMVTWLLIWFSTLHKCLFQPNQQSDVRIKNLPHMFLIFLQFGMFLDSEDLSRTIRDSKSLSTKRMKQTWCSTVWSFSYGIYQPLLNLRRLHEWFHP